MKKIVLVCCLFTIGFSSTAQKFDANWNSLNQRKMPTWFNQDKFGIFIHWGVYSVPAYAPVMPNSGYSYAEWYWYRLFEKQKDFIAFHNKNYGSSFAYPQFEPMFKAEMYDPNQWADIFKRSGAKYVVLTSKHHEGYALWNSAEADKTWGRPWNSVTGTPKRDLLGDLTNSVRNAGLKMGVYYSLYEWFNPMWKYDKKRYVSEHMTPQFKDLVTKYKPSIIFSDGEWDLPDSAWKSPELLAWLFNESPVKDEVVVDDRWGNNTRQQNHGAMYTTSEYGSGMDASIIWEESQGIGHSYGYNRNEQLDDYKTSHDLILMLSDIVSRGGNFLLDIGPDADGNIPVILQQRLLDIGDWLKINGEAIYGTVAKKQPAQWSEGYKVPKSDKSFMADYKVSRLVVPKKDTSYIESFFTKKGNNTYCIIPSYRKSITINDIHLAKNSKAEILGSSVHCAWKQKGNQVTIDLSNLKPGDISGSGIFVIKLTE
ncbi:MAG: alpha-L-fucosidase [Chitinophagia bacterium]|jgi:alpha-L-fucosidase|nr:alpha-L-fucosidase [Chitinophagia bacterium]